MSELMQPHLRHLRVAGYSKNTIHTREWLLSNMDEELPEGIDSALPDELSAYLDRDKWAQWTRVTYYRHITGFYRWAAGGREPYLTYDPSADLAKPKNPESVPHPVDDEEVALVLKRANDRWRIIITLAAFAGLRAGEITRQRREDVTEERIRIVKGKGDRDAYIPTHPEVWRVAQYMPSGLLVPSLRGTQLGSTSLTKLARCLFDRWGMDELHLHRFRHWYGTKLVQEGNDIRVVQELMRHKSITTTAGYVRVVDEQRRLAICTLPVPSSPLKDAA